MSRVRFVNTFETAAPFLADVMEALEARGIRVDALVARATYRPVDDARSGPRFTTVRIPALLGRSKRLVTLAYALVAPLHLLFGRRACHVLLTQPPMLFVVGAAICRLRRMPYVVHGMDLHPDLLVAIGALRRGGMLERALSRLARWALRGAGAVAVIGRCMERRLLAQGVARERMIRTRNWAPGSIRPVPREDNAFRAAHDLRHRFVVLYLGNMGVGHDLETALRAAERLRDRPEVLFLFVGAGVRRREVERAIAAGAPNVRSMGHQPPAALAGVLSAADLHLISLRAGYEGIMVPSKFYSALASGRPVLYVGTEHGEVGAATLEHGCGVVVPPGDVEGLRGAVLAYLDDPARARRDGERALDCHEQFYDGPRTVEAYVRDLSRVFGLRGAAGGVEGRLEPAAGAGAGWER